MILYTEIDTPVGEVTVAERDGAVVAVGFTDRFDGLRERVGRRFVGESWCHAGSGSADALVAYVSGDLAALDALAVDVAGTPFQERVWQALRAIPVGHTWSYADLADAIGSPGAVRAVGTANGANPVSLVVPCHRVVRSDGSLGGYGGGLERKVWLLAHEGARLT